MINRRESIKRTLQIFAACVAFSATAHAADVSVHGSTTVASNLLMPKKAQIEKASGHSLSVVANGSSRGVMDLVSGKVYEVNDSPREKAFLSVSQMFQSEYP